MTVSLWPLIRLVRRPCRAKYDTDSDQVKYIILPGSLTLSPQLHAHGCMHVMHTELTYGPLW